MHRFHANVVFLSLASLLTDVASELCLPLIPLLMVSVGGGATALGLMEGAADTVNALVKWQAGALSDRGGARKPWVLMGYAVAALARPLSALAGAPVHLVGVRALDRVGKGLRTAPRDALLADSTAPADRAAAFGFHRSLDHLGAVIGAVLAAAVLSGGASDGAVRAAFLASLLPGGLAVALILLKVRDLPHPPAHPPAHPSPAAQSPAPGARWLLMVTTWFAAFRLQEVLLLARLMELGVAAASLPLFWAALHVVKSTTGAPMGRLADRVGRGRALVAGYACYAAGMALLASATSLPGLAGAALVFALHHGLNEGVEKALISTAWPARARGRGFGVYHGLSALVALPAGAAQGFLMEHHGMAALGLTLAGGGVVAALLAAGWLRFSSPPAGS